MVKGDTLYSIAFRSGMDVASLISINGISPPYNIYPVSSSGWMALPARWSASATRSAALSAAIGHL